MAKNIVVYHQPGCPPCHRAMEFLTEQRVPFVAKDVSADEKAAEELMALGSMSTPTIVVDGQMLVGFNPQRLLQLVKG
jgi:glutaredoxin